MSVGPVVSDRDLEGNKRVGFRTLLEFEDATDEWTIIAWRGR